jgi:hypothetical protein
MLHGVIQVLIALGFIAVLVAPCVVASRVDLDAEDLN